MTRPHVLYLTHRAPYPPNKGERIRCLHLLQYLNRRAQVHLATLADEPFTPDDQAALSGYCQRLAVVPLGRWRWGRALISFLCGRTVSEGAFFAPELYRLVGAWAAETPFQAVVISASSLAPYLRHPALTGALRVVDLIDVDSQKWFDYSAGRWGPRAWLHWLEGRRLRRLEARLATESHGLTLVTDAEVRLFREFCRHGDVREASCGVDLDAFHPQALPQEVELDEPVCVFVGALNYPPNIDGAVWFCREVWPTVQQVCPRARVQLVGRQPGQKVRELALLPGVEVIGSVPDVRPYVARAQVCIAPLRIARGIQNKVLESLAMGKATVVTSTVLGGLHTEPEKHLLVADHPAEWANALGQLFANPQRRRQLGARGRAFVEEHHRWERCLAPFAELLRLPE